MSRIGKLPVTVPNGVTIDIKDNKITLKGPKGELNEKLHPSIKLEIKDGQIVFTRTADDKPTRSLHGLTRKLVSNMVEGVTKGFEKRLEIIGVGYKAAASGSKLTLNLGFSHPIEYIAPKGIMFEIDKEKKNIVIISGIDKQMLGEVAAKIRSYKKPEPYKGKGIRYVGENVPRKAGKAAAKGE
ncbi:50S ribosomal protein L6 [Candidatus Peregrinibacteria bacterium]|nr:50S ribosomal protein L6 [Candidatus Peregrinibacteria bacterium]